MTARQLKQQVIDDLRVELTDEFDRNFERKAFFTKRWKPRRNKRALGSLLHVTGTLRRSIKGVSTDSGVRFTSNVPYANVHNEGFHGMQHVRQTIRHNHKTGKAYTVRAHSRRTDIPERRFIGNSKEVEQIVRSVLDDNIKRFEQELARTLRK